jgi:hypothetical protein
MVTRLRRTCMLAARRAAPPCNCSCGGPPSRTISMSFPQDAAGMAGAESLHRRFLRRKSAGEMRDGVAPPRTIGDLLFGEHPMQEAIAVALERFRNPRQIRRVQTNSDDVHVRAPA